MTAKCHTPNESAEFISKTKPTIALDITKTTLLLFFLSDAGRLSTFQENQKPYNVLNKKIQENDVHFLSSTA